jgi:DNA-binding winged helix-turn-helix (wHTH) protein
VSSGAVFSFGPFHLDSRSRRLLREREPVAVSDRHLEILLALASHPGTVLSKDALISAAWGDVAVGDNSLEQAISSLRRTLGSKPDGTPYIETLARRGYRFTTTVSKSAAREDDSSLDALLAPHRAFIQGRADLEPLGHQSVVHAREVFERVILQAGDYAPAHVGLANAIALGFEAMRADRPPDPDALHQALHHAREACRLDPSFAEAWATLGLVLLQAGARELRERVVCDGRREVEARATCRVRTRPSIKRSSACRVTSSPSSPERRWPEDRVRRRPLATR